MVHGGSPPLSDELRGAAIFAITEKWTLQPPPESGMLAERKNRRAAPLLGKRRESEMKVWFTDWQEPVWRDINVDNLTTVGKIMRSEGVPRVDGDGVPVVIRVDGRKVTSGFFPSDGSRISVSRDYQRALQP